LGWNTPLKYQKTLYGKQTMVRCSPNSSDRGQVPTIEEHDGDLRGAPRPNDIAQTSELLAQGLSRTEFENKLNEWVRDAAPGEDRLTAKERMMK